ncbi:MAG: hypothetical protein ACRENB_12270 [Gemmatimonadales bacterium]
MLTLRVLGAPELSDTHGREVQPVLRQPKRLAFLAYLVLARPRRFQRRDALLGLFWPELDQYHARAALRRTLYFLRRELGEEVLQNRGDEELGLAPASIWCDAVAFDELIGRGSLVSALELYRGDLLDSFYVAGAPGVEEWLAQERTRLQDTAGRAALELAQRAGPPVQVERWARRAYELRPHDEAAAETLLGLLAARGDRVGVHRVWQEFGSRLTHDLELLPSTALRSRVERLLDQSSPPFTISAPAAPAVATAELHRDLILILPFEVRGDGSLGYLRDGIVDLLSAKLDGAGVYRVVEPRTGLAAVRDLPEPIEPPLAGTTAARLGAGLALLGSIVEAAGRITVTAALCGADGTVVRRLETGAGGEDQIFFLIDELARQLLTLDPAGPPDPFTRLAALTTGSLPALKAWLSGERAFRLARYLEAAVAFGRAAGIDPDFALAHYRLAAALTASALIETARQASVRAYEGRDRLGPHDRMLVEAQQAWLRGASGEAERRYAAIVTAFPESQEAWFLLGDVQIHSNPYRGRSIALARPAFERAHALDRRHLASLLQLVRLAALERRHEDLVRLVERALALEPDADADAGLRTLRAFAAGTEPERTETTSRLSEASGLAIGRAFADVALYTGDLAAAERMGTRLFAAARSEEFRAIGHLMLAHLALARGGVTEAFDRLREAERYEPSWALEIRAFFAALPFLPLEPEFRAGVRDTLQSWDPAEARPSFAMPLAFHNEVHSHLRKFLLGILAIRLGELEAAAEAAGTLEELPVSPASGPLVAHLLRTLHAERLRAAGSPADALALLEMPSADVWFQAAVTSPFFAGTYERFLRAELLAEAGRTVEALAWWDAIAQRTPFELPFLAPSRSREAVLWQAVGDAERGERCEDQARVLWGSGPRC